MSFIVISILFFITGLFTGILAGMLGIGGGLIFVPILYLLLPFTPIDKAQISYIAIGTSLFSAAITSISSGANHYLAKNVEKRKALFLAIGSVISSIIASFLVIKVEPFYLKLIFGLVFVIISVKMFSERNSKNKKQIKDTIILHEYFAIFFGFLIGIFAAFTGLGGGILFVPVLTFLFGVNIKKAIGTSSLVISITGVAAASAYATHIPKGSIAPFQFGYIYFVAGLPLSIGAAIGAIKGVKIVLGSSSEKIKKIFSILLVLIVVKILLGI